MKKNYKSSKLIKLGDFIFILLFIFLILFIFTKVMNFPDGQYLKIEIGKNQEYFFNLESDLEKKLGGPLGSTEIIIKNKKVRIKNAPCNKKYCIHQGWINKMNQAIVCIPNQVSLSIVGTDASYDSTNY